MDWNGIRRRRCTRWVPALLAFRLAAADLHRSMITGWMLAGFLLLVAVGGVMSYGAGEVSLEAYRQGILQAHPEWPSDVRAAVTAGIICAGMPPDMVRAAWGNPTRTSGRGGPGQRETWHYEGRPSAVERLGGQTNSGAGAHEWTVSFIDGLVVEWTD
jgi:hypothetical protein